VRRFIIVLAAAIAAWAGVGAIANAASLGVDAFGRLPNVELMDLSPSGEALAYVVVQGDQRLFLVKDLTGKLLFQEILGDNKVRGVNWADDDHVMIGVTGAETLFTDLGEYWHTYVVNLKTGKGFWVFHIDPAVLHATYGYFGASATGGRSYGYFGGVTLSKSRGLDATFNEHNFVDLYRVDLDSGEAELAASGQLHPHGWALDAKGAVVAYSTYDVVTGDWALKTKDGQALTTIREPLGDIGLVGLGRIPGTVTVEKAIPEEWTLADGSHAPLEASRLIQNYLIDPATRRLVGVTLEGDTEAQEFFDPVLKAKQASLRKALGGNPMLLAWSTDFRRLIVHTDGDGDAGTYWLIDGPSAKPYAYDYPEIPDANVGSTRVVVYKAADGLEMHGVLTLPPGRDPKTLPLIVLPHGGPEAHDVQHFDWWAQAFADRGYAVFQPNFRGSDGYGLEFRDAGFGQWGRKMQTDISDGVAELAREGLVDPKRACIVGGSYGGYAALAGVTVQQGLYRCASSYGGISDLNYLLNTVAPADEDDRNPQTRYMRKFLGVRDNDDPALHALSPARLASQADAPIQLIYGATDTVVAIGQSQEMARNLKAAGKPVEVIEIKGEDHWLSRDATRKQVLAAMVAFVEKYNPPN